MGAKKMRTDLILIKGMWRLVVSLDERFLVG